MKDKPIWQSKTMIAAFAIGAIWMAQYYGVNLPYEPIYTILGLFGVYGVRDAIAANSGKK